MPTKQIKWSKSSLWLCFSWIFFILMCVSKKQYILLSSLCMILCMKSAYVTEISYLAKIFLLLFILLFKLFLYTSKFKVLCKSKSMTISKQDSMWLIFVNICSFGFCARVCLNLLDRNRIRIFYINFLERNTAVVYVVTVISESNCEKWWMRHHLHTNPYVQCSCTLVIVCLLCKCIPLYVFST